MGSDPPDLGKGLFGYRKSAVNQIIADRDMMLRLAEGRVRSAEAKVAELETELSSFREQNARMDEQLDRLRSQLDVVLARTETGSAARGSEEEAPSQEDLPDWDRPHPAEVDQASESFDPAPTEQRWEPEPAAAEESEPPAPSEPHFEPALPVAAQEEAPMSESPHEAPRAEAQPEWMPAPSSPRPAEPAAYGGEPDRYQPATPPPDATEPRRDDVTSRFLTEELAGILAAAEESAARIVERARASTQRQIMESNRLWREVQAEVARFASWRDQVEPVIQQVQSKVGSVRGLVDDVPERIRDALAPMADAISSIDADMAELASALTPPLLLTPSGFEHEGQSWLSRAAQTNLEVEAPEESSQGQGARTYEDGDTTGPVGAEAG